MTKKIFHSILLVAGAVLLASLFVITGALYEYFGIIQKKQLKDELGLAAVSVEQQGDDFLKRLSPDRYRITWIIPKAMLYTTPVRTLKALKTTPTALR